nr:hypothetical protein CFP56_55666 [Quercus suber]
MPRRLRRAHKPQAVVGEVVGLEGVDVVEVVEVVMRMRMTRMMRCWRATGACTWMALGHRDALLTLGSAHDGGCIFVPTPSRSTPPIVQAEPTQDPSFPNPDEPVAQIEQIQSENIGQVRQDRQSQL